MFKAITETGNHSDRSAENDALKRLQIIYHQIGHLRAAEDSLLNGNLGLIPYHYLVPKTLGITDGPETAAAILDEVLDRMNEEKSSIRSFHYSNGLAGLGALIQYLIRENVIDFDFNEEFELLDEIIFENALKQVEGGYAEFFHGGAGVLHYFGSRDPHPKIDLYISDLLRAILRQVEADPLDFRIPRSKFAWTENDDYDLSMSHGLCGSSLVLLTLLPRLNKTDSELVKKHLKKVAEHISGLAVIPNPSADRFSFLPSYLPKGISLETMKRDLRGNDTRLAWCYGDLGWVLFFYEYGKLTSDTKYTKLADEMGISSALRITVQETASSTAHFCHGHAGLAQFYRKLFHVTGKPEYQNAYNYWIKNTMETLDRETAVGFHKSHGMETSFLEGLVGISLVLNTFVTKTDDSWNHFFLL